MHGTVARRAMGPPAWFPDWRGECVAIVASGPSTSKANVEALRDRIHVIAIKKNVELCPWADVVYGCDAAWWKSARGLPDYKGLKLSWASDACRLFPDVRKIDIEGMEQSPPRLVDHILTSVPARIGNGGNSGFQAVNLAVQFGATGVLLIGFDMHGRSGPHWYGRNTWNMANNPSDDNYLRWRKAFDDAAGKLCAAGVDVINASPISALICFRRKTVEQALADWGLHPRKAR